MLVCSAASENDRNPKPSTSRFSENAVPSTDDDQVEGKNMYGTDSDSGASEQQLKLNSSGYCTVLRNLNL